MGGFSSDEGWFSSFRFFSALADATPLRAFWFVSTNTRLWGIVASGMMELG